MKKQSWNKVQRALNKVQNSQTEFNRVQIWFAQKLQITNGCVQSPSPNNLQWNSKLLQTHSKFIKVRISQSSNGFEESPKLKQVQTKSKIGKAQSVTITCLKTNVHRFKVQTISEKKSKICEVWV